MIASGVESNASRLL